MMVKQFSLNCMAVRAPRTLTAERIGGHTAETPSSGCAAPPLRYGPFGMTASRRRGKVASMMFWCAMRPIGRDRPPKRHEGKRPSTRAAVKAGEDARAAGRLDGEHGDGSATVRQCASISPLCEPTAKVLSTL